MIIYAKMLGLNVEYFTCHLEHTHLFSGINSEYVWSTFKSNLNWFYDIYSCTCCFSSNSRPENERLTNGRIWWTACNFFVMICSLASHTSNKSKFRVCGGPVQPKTDMYRSCMSEGSPKFHSFGATLVPDIIHNLFIPNCISNSLRYVFSDQ